MYNKAHFDWDQLPPLTSPRRPLDLKGVALGLINLPPLEGYTFTHTHREQEEVYMVLAGTGRLLVDGEEVPLAAGDMVRVDPASKRALKNDGDTPLRLICAGAVPAGYPKHPESRYLIDDGVPDYDDIPPWYAGNAEVAAKNAELKQRYERSQQRRKNRDSRDSGLWTRDLSMTKTNVVLIGMPGAGKSTVGVVLAKRLGFDFLDTDVLIQARQGRRLQEIIDSEGLAAFRRIEEAALLSLACRRSVIATGGSAVYSEAGMAALKAYGTIVFLDLPLEELTLRVRDMDTRGMVIDPGETFADLFARRLPLYLRWSELTIDGRDKSVEELAAEIATCLQDHLPTPA